MFGRWRSDFDDIASDYDQLFQNIDELTRLEALSLDAILRRYGAHSVLDCACGTGLQSIGLAQMGYEVFASDISGKMLKCLQAKARSKGVSIETRRADFRTLAAWRDKTFDAVICCGNSLPTVPRRADMTRALISMKSRLRISGGIVVIGLRNYPMLREKEETFLLRRVALDGDVPEIVFDVRLFRDDRVSVTHFFVRFFRGRWRVKAYAKLYFCLSPAELKQMMVNAGLRSVTLLDMRGIGEYKGGEWLFAVGEG